ncbi:HAMP domain-containing sensor histidine kinase [Patulibacter sp. NPDC049589]|uniref:sensor histidine kinase n=1 Tax=Patulibacter sp. NPDC049589 TaxID=3154731 RepID=UPI00342D6067
MSLRVRLIALLFVLTAVAMMALATVTYTSQRSALLDQVDQQLATARPGVAQRLVRANDDDGSVGDGPSGTGGDLIPGSYGQLRTASGQALGTPVKVAPAFNATALSSPALPATLGPDETLTVQAQDGSSLRYRVRTFALGGAPGAGDGGGRRGGFGQTAQVAGAAVAVVAIPLTEVDATLSQLLKTEILVIVVALGLLTLLTWLLVRIGLRPLDRMTATAGEIAAGDLDQRVVPADGRTEVGRLGAALNGMLGRLEGAFAERSASEARLRRFLSDASHELRTPLASIRGYAELFRVGAVNEPEDLKKAMGRIEDEAARMGVLVEDLLVLARLDEAPEKDHAPVDVAQIAEDAAEDARVIDTDRRITVRTDGERIVQGDDGQLRQVVTNLVRNALVHTPAGGPIDISTVRSGDRVEIEVRDHGRGLPTDDPQTLFDRFWRSEGGRTRGKGGAGLGLAIVATIVSAHHGTVEARNADDGGASFVVRLPVRTA